MDFNDKENEKERKKSRFVVGYQTVKPAFLFLLEKTFAGSFSHDRRGEATANFPLFPLFLNVEVLPANEQRGRKLASDRSRDGFDSLAWNYI